MFHFQYYLLAFLFGLDALLYPLGGTSYFPRTYSLALSVLVGAIAVSNSLGRSVNNAGTTYSLLYTIGTAWLFVTAVSSESFERPSEVLAFMVATAAILWGVSRNFDKIDILKGSIWGFTFAAVISAAIIYKDLGIGGFRVVEGYSGLSAARMEEAYTGPNRNALGQVWFAAIFSISLGFIFRLIERKIWFVPVLFFYFLALLSLSIRGIFASSLCLIALILWFMQSTNRNANDKSNRLLFLLIIGLVSLTVVTAIPDFGQSVDVAKSKVLGIFGIRTEVAGMREGDYGLRASQGRIELVSQTLQIFLDNPLTGIGIENTRLYLTTYSHNDLAELLAGGGILAPVPFLLAYWLALSVAYKSSSKEIRGIVLVLLVLSILSYAATTGLFRAKPLHTLLVLLLLALHNQGRANLANRRATGQHQRSVANKRRIIPDPPREKDKPKVPVNQQ